MVDNIYNQAMGGLLHIFEPDIGLGPYIGESISHLQSFNMGVKEVQTGLNITLRDGLSCRI